MSKSEQTITAADLCALVGIKPRMLRQLGEEEIIPAPKSGGYPLVESLKKLFAHYRQAADARAMSTKHREAYARARTKRLDLETKRLEGELMPAADHIEEMRRSGEITRAVLIDQLLNNFVTNAPDGLQKVAEKTAQDTIKIICEQMRHEIMNAP